MLATVVDQLTELDDHAFTEHFRDLELAHRRLDAEMAAIIAEGERRNIAAVDDHHSMKGWLKANANWSNAHVARTRKLAKTITALPTVGDALLAGRIGIDQADELARVASNRRVADQLPDSIEVLLVQAEQLSFEDARTCLRRWETLADIDGANRDRQLSHERRTATVTELDGSLYARATGGTAEVAAEMASIFNQALEKEFAADVAERTRLHGPDAPASMLSRTDAQRRFDAMTAIFRRSVSVPANAKTPAPLVYIIVDQRTLEEALARRGLIPEPTDLPDTDLSERCCQTTNGTPLTPDAALRAAMQGHIRRVVFNSAGVVINMGRKRRLFTGAARDAARLMATCCDFPGCDIPGEHTQIDHLDEYGRDNGNTDIENAGLGCGGHNRAKTRKHYTAKRHTNGRVIYYRPDGTPMLPVGRRLPPHTDTNDVPGDDDLPDEHDIEQLTRLARARVAALRSAA